MPYIQPRTANYFGFMPYDAQPGGLIQTNAYVVSSSEAAIYIGDVVTLTSIDTVKAVTGAFSTMILGVAAQFLGANLGTTGSTGVTFNNPLSSQMLLVYDSPHQLFTVCDTTSGIMGSTAMNKNVAVLSSGAVGSTGPNTVSLNRSVMAISGVTASSGAALPFKVMGLHPVETGWWSTDAGSAGVAASVRKYIVKPNNHIYAQGTGQASVITS